MASVWARMVRRLILQHLQNVHTALPAKVESVDLARGRVVVTPLVDGMQPIVEVPISCVKAGPFTVRPPYQKDDVVLVVFAERALDHLLTGPVQADPLFSRRHALDDAVIVGTLRHASEPELPSDHAEDLLLWLREPEFKVYLTPEGHFQLENVDLSIKLFLDKDGLFTLEYEEPGTKLEVEPEGLVRLTVGDHVAELDPEGSVTVTAGPHVVTLDPDGPAVVASPDLRLGGPEAEEGVPLGVSLKDWLDSHVHTHPEGPTGPPTSPSPEPSERVKVE